MRILNIGSLNIDKTYTVETFVQPKETIKAVKYEEFCGGKGLNQSIAMAKAGAEIYHAGMIGKDGEALRKALEQAGVHTDYIRQTNGASGHAVIQIDALGQNNIIVTGGANDAVDQEYICSVLNEFQAGDLLLMQNEVPNLAFAVKEAKKRGMTVVLNPSPMNETVLGCESLDLVDCFIVNEVEGKALADCDSDEPEFIMERLKEKYPKAAFVLTLGENGSYYFDNDECVYQKAFSVEAVDTTGAGDTFCGYFLAGVAENLTTEENLRRAGAAAAIAVTYKGATTGIPEKTKVLRFLEERNDFGSQREGRS